MRHALAIGILVLAGACGKQTPPAVTASEPTPTPETVWKWFDKYAVRIPVARDNWLVDLERVGNLRIGSVVRGPGEKEWTATVAFSAMPEDRALLVEGELRYKASDADPNAFVYVGYTTTSVRTGSH